MKVKRSKLVQPAGLFAAALFLFAAAAAPGPARAVEYFVSVDGDDAGNGLAPATAFRTVQRGVDALAPGDTLTIGPGEYFEAVARSNMGGADADTLIRAGIPGTVLLRGDEPAPDFRRVPGYRFVYAAAFPRHPQALNETDTMSILETAPSLAELEFTPGRFHYDEAAGALYISTSDFQPPERHLYTVCTLGGRGGMFIHRGQRVIVDGLAATGFNSREPLPRLQGGNTISDVIPWGFFLSQSRRSVVRNCTAFSNAGGIAIQSGTYGVDNAIEACTAYGNHSTRGSSGGNMTVFNPHDDVIRNSRAWRGLNHGIRMHGDSEEPRARFEGNLSWGHDGADFQMKTGSAALVSMVDRCVAPRKSFIAPNVTNSIVGQGGGRERGNIYLQEEPDLDPRAEFADPDNHDYRLQATSRFRSRGAGPDDRDRGPFPYEANIFYLDPAGDDEADGLSAARAWRTPGRAFRGLRPGDTIYLAAGAYEAPGVLRAAGTEAQPVAIRGRGRGRAVLTGPLALADSTALNFERLDFSGPVTVTGSRDIGFENCRFLGGGVALAAEATEGLRIEHGVFTGFTRSALRFAGSGRAFLRGNLFDNGSGPALETDRPEAVLYSEYNSYRRADAAWRVGGRDTALIAVRPRHERYSREIAPRFETGPDGPRLLNTGDFAARGPLGHPVGTWRPDDGEERQLTVIGPFLQSVTATTANLEWWSSVPETFEVRWGATPEAEHTLALAPTSAYHPVNPLENFNSFSLTGLEPGATYHFRLGLAGEERGALTFTTAPVDLTPRTLFVAPGGDDAADGLGRETAFRTIGRAAARARPGDTVLVTGGTYHELVRVRTTGDTGRPITFRAAPGEKVTLDGYHRNLEGAFSVANKAFIRLDGFYFSGFQRVRNQGVIRVNRSRDVEITRCYSHGQGGPEFISAGAAENLLVRNCVLNAGWDGIGAGSSPGLRIENNVILRPSIRPICLSEPSRVSVRGNIITDNLTGKRGSFLVQRSDQVEVANNCFFLRWPETERSVFGRDAGTLAEYEREAGIARPNLVANPRFAALDDESAAGTDLFTDNIPGQIRDFPDAFARNPELARRGIGLQPEAFADFHFNKQ